MQYKYNINTVQKQYKYSRKTIQMQYKYSTKTYILYTEDVPSYGQCF